MSAQSSGADPKHAPLPPLSRSSSDSTGQPSPAGTWARSEKSIPLDGMSPYHRPGYAQPTQLERGQEHTSGYVAHPLPDFSKARQAQVGAVLPGGAFELLQALDMHRAVGGPQAARGPAKPAPLEGLASAAPGLHRASSATSTLAAPLPVYAQRHATVQQLSSAVAARVQASPSHVTAAAFGAAAAAAAAPVTHAPPRASYGAVPGMKRSRPGTVHAHGDAAWQSHEAQRLGLGPDLVVGCMGVAVVPFPMPFDQEADDAAPLPVLGNNWMLDGSKDASSPLVILSAPFTRGPLFRLADLGRAYPADGVTALAEYPPFVPTWPAHEPVSASLTAAPDFRVYLLDHDGKLVQQWKGRTWHPVAVPTPWIRAVHLMNDGRLRVLVYRKHLPISSNFGDSPFRLALHWPSFPLLIYSSSFKVISKSPWPAGMPAISFPVASAAAPSGGGGAGSAAAAGISGSTLQDNPSELGVQFVDLDSPVLVDTVNRVLPTHIGADRDACPDGTFAVCGGYRAWQQYAAAGLAVVNAAPRPLPGGSRSSAGR